MNKVKRPRKVEAKVDQLKMGWGSDGCGNVGIVYAWGDGVTKHDAHILNELFAIERYNSIGETKPSLKEELLLRGYDITTLKFTISKFTNDV